MKSERFPTVPNGSPERFPAVPRFPPIGDRELHDRDDIAKEASGTVHKSHSVVVSTTLATNERRTGSPSVSRPPEPVPSWPPDVAAQLAELLADLIIADIRRYPARTVASPAGPNRESDSPQPEAPCRG